MLKNIEKQFPETAYKIYNNYGSALEAQNNYHRALLLYLKALSVAELKKKKEISLAYLNQNIAKIYLLLGKADSSRFYFNNSITISQNLLAKDEIQLGLFFQNTGLFYKNIGMLGNAMEYYQKAENILIKRLPKNDSRLDALYSNMGSIYLLQGDYEHAIEYFNNSYLIFLHSKSNDLIKKITLLKNLANVYFYTTDYEKTYELITEILNTSKKISKDSKTEIPYSLIARYYTKIKQFTLAEEYQIKNLNQMHQLYGEISHPYASALMNLGQFYMMANRFELSKYNLDYSLRILLSLYGEKHPAVSQSYMSLGNYYFTTGDVKNAVSNFSKALKSFNISLSDKNTISAFLYQSNGYEISALNILRKLGFAYIKMAEIEKKSIIYYKMAMQSLEAAISIANALQSGYLNEESKLFIISDQQNSMSKATLVALKLYDLTNNQIYLNKAFSFTEKSKSIVLLSSLKDMEAKIFSKIPQELFDKEKQINEEIAIFRELLIKEQQKQKPDLKMTDTWQQKVFELIKLKESLTNDYKKKYPAYYNSKFQTESITIQDIQKKIKNKQCMVEYYFGDTSLIIFFIDKKQIQYKSVKTDSTFFADINWLLNFLSNGAYSENVNSTFNQFNVLSNKMFSTLIGDFKGYTGKKKLIIIPDNILAFLPFEILLTRKSSKSKADYRKLDYLLNSSIISYAYSASLAFTKFKTKKRHNNKILAVAPEYKNFESLNPEKEIAIREYKNILVPLKGVEEEVNMIKKKTKAKVLISNSATEKNFKQLAPDYSILHLAMHTIIDNEKPLYSKLVFSLNNDTNEDGMLNTYELYNLNLHAKLAVLSACNTGFGRYQKGEGVMSLARGFIYAGCPNIIMTLWALEDKAGFSLMSDFYRYLRKGNKTDIALTKAKTEYLKKSDILKSHPYFWAGYVSIGSSRAFSSYQIIISIIAGVLILTILAIVLIRKKRKLTI